MNKFDLLINHNTIVTQYEILAEYHKKHLQDKGVKLPRLMHGNNYSKSALVLIYLSYGYPDTDIVTKEELTKYIEHFYGRVNDVQQARHLGAQNGWYILAGGRHDINVEAQDIPSGSYKLYSLEEPYPNFNLDRRSTSYGIDEFENLKKHYNYRCATCGSEEGKPNYHWPNTITVLQAGHMDPNKPLEKGNIIPQCSKCNRPDRNWWIYDSKGRVISIANPIVINRCSDQVQKSIYKILKRKFEK